MAGTVIASHYATPVERKLGAASDLRAGPSLDSEIVAQLNGGERYLLLDDTLGWAWGYAGDDRIVGYVESGRLT